MRYPASEKLEIIRLVEGSHLSARMTLAKLGIPRTTFYRWYDRYLCLTLLAPDIVEAILDGKQGPKVTLSRVLEPFPMEWAAQPNHFATSPEAVVDATRGERR